MKTNKIISGVSALVMAAANVCAVSAQSVTEEELSVPVQDDTTVSAPAEDEAGDEFFTEAAKPGRPGRPEISDEDKEEAEDAEKPEWEGRPEDAGKPEMPEMPELPEMPEMPEGPAHEEIRFNEDVIQAIKDFVDKISSLLPDFSEFEGFEITDGFGIKELKDMFRDIIKANKENAKPEGHRHGFEEFTGLKKFEVSEGNDELASEDGVLFDKDMKKLLKYPAGKEDEEFTVPEGVETIAPHAFDGCKNLKKVELPESVKEIGKGAFADVEDDDNVNLADLAALKMKLVGRDKVLGPKPAEDILAVEEAEVTEDAAE